MNDQDIAAKKAALTAIMVRNADVLKWYIDKMFANMPPMYVKVMFKAFSMIDKEGRITQENMWMLIPAFISSLPIEHFAVFLEHIGGFADCLNNEYIDYLAETQTSTSTSSEEATQSVSLSGLAYDSDGPDGKREDDASEHHSTRSDESAVSDSDIRYQRRGTILSSEREDQVSFYQS